MADFPIVLYMLTHKHRFHGHGSLRYLFSKGKVARSRHLLLRYVPNANRLHSRFAVVISKKIHKQSVYRNRVRRRIFEIVRNEFPSIDGSYDVTITVFSPEVLTLPHDKLREEIIQLFEQAGMTAPRKL